MTNHRAAYERRGRAARAGDPEFGTVCSCGRQKSRQAWTCQTCHGRARGYRCVPLPAQRAAWNLSRYGITAGASIGASSTLQRRDDLERARAAAIGELAALAAEQERDERYGNRAGAPWIVSLDAADCYGRPRHETLAAAAALEAGAGG